MAVKKGSHPKKLDLAAIVKVMHGLLDVIKEDLSSAFEKGNKAASQRVRVNTILLEKASKAYRKVSIAAEKGTKKTGKSKAKPKMKAKVAAPKKAAPKKAAPKKAVARGSSGKAPARRATASHKPGQWK